ncbi:MAG: UDP-N-acetylmuramoylalanyl-D-glutamyl-2, 6-diaminopimelate--D-alanyl-D-alanine ligase [Clostridiales bacterium]|nr:UDP-N-acetylmuramoylalanyl-D-glutamyl-2, 6-diaminopimelate--D-alanyl-D-alanine ligase [Clostridiales bacterium]
MASIIPRFAKPLSIYRSNGNKNMKQYLFSEIVAASGGVYHGDPALLKNAATDVVINSELAMPGSLFIAIIGEKHDGHKFIPVARGKGASLVVTDRALDSEPFLLVPDTLRAMHAIAKTYRDKFTIPVIGLTGSAGKTSTKDIVAAALSEKFNVMKTQGNLNNETGAALTIFSLEEAHQVAVVEMGTNHFGEIGRIASFVKPDYCLFTNIGLAHIENFGTREGIFAGKTEMLPHMRAGGRVIANGDDDLLRSIPEALLYGLDESCAVRGTEIEDLILRGMRFTANHQGKTYRMHVPSLGVHSVYNALAAVSVGLLLGMEMEEIASGIETYKPLRGRMNVHEQAFFTVIDDTYNANPTSMKASLDVLKACSGRRVAILGDMRELGESAPQMHEDVGRYAASLGIERIICVGTESKRMLLGAESVAPGHAQYFETQDELLKVLSDLVRQGDVILVKASRGMKLEQTIERLLALAD